jgi:hypothetical protein
MAGSCEHGNEPLGSIKGKVFNEPMIDHQFLKNDLLL